MKPPDRAAVVAEAVGKERLRASAEVDEGVEAPAFTYAICYCTQARAC